MSAFAPICSPTRCDWGRKALGGYLGDDQEAWKEYDATELMEAYTGPDLHLFIDQGADDEFYRGGQLQPEVFEVGCERRARTCCVAIAVSQPYVGVHVACGCRKRAPQQSSPSVCGSSTATITATTSSRLSLRTTSIGTPTSLKRSHGIVQAVSGRTNTGTNPAHFAMSHAPPHTTKNP